MKYDWKKAKWPLIIAISCILIIDFMVAFKDWQKDIARRQAEMLANAKVIRLSPEWSGVAIPDGMKPHVEVRPQARCQYRINENDTRVAPFGPGDHIILPDDVSYIEWRLARNQRPIGSILIVTFSPK